MSLLDVSSLGVSFGNTTAVDGVSFSVDPGQVVGLVGESGCGKSVTSLAIMGLLPSKGVNLEGSIEFDGRNLLELSPKQLRRLRGTELAMVFQDPLSSLNPVLTIGHQITEMLSRHRKMKGKEAKNYATELLDRVGIPEPRRRLSEYPHQLSGGMRQRVLIAIAVACAPKFLIADEPTTALDVTIQAQILELLKELVDEEGTAMLMITHDMGVVAGVCDDVNVLYSGRVVESAPASQLFAAPTHPYTSGLLGSIPRIDSNRDEPLNPIRGSIVDLISWQDGCAFAPRCDHVQEGCLRGDIPLEPKSAQQTSHQHRCWPEPTVATADVAAESEVAQ
ncbi:ABC transporter ATP-binding protein [Haloglycomyces albus]|uniref:ABC transporter ATP-binding protein n=1 Tax=Haloglycomyces albus TaxID=526067 RepID=UPI00046D0D2A|nr:ABC transporter ATP-binding protein [Haloglycomyces albus]